VRALVLSGGGARGAYEAGALRFILDELPKRLGHPVRFDLLCGTSVGAIHACYLAATAHQDHEARGERLASVWRGFRLEEVLPLSTLDLLQMPRRLLGLWRGGAALVRRRPERLYGLLDTTRLSKIVEDSIPWRSIRKNVAEQRVRAVCVAATQIVTGHTIVFVEGREPGAMRWTREPTVVPRPARLTPSHALASAAIPVLFPAVRVGSTYYSDGGLRLNTPLMPAVYLGADRVLVIGLSNRSQDRIEAAAAERRIEAYGNPIFMFGKVLNALLLDHLDTDLARMRLVNDLLAAGMRAYGPAFIDRLNGPGVHQRGTRYRMIDDVVIRPSVGLGAVAGNVLERKRGEPRLAPLLRFFLRALGSGGTTSESDLLSYLLFDEAYAVPAMELGFADARAHEEDLLRFFSDEPMRAL
jgi:NTE family protein